MNQLKELLLVYREKNPTDKSIKDDSINNQLDNLFLDVCDNNLSLAKIRKIKSSLILLDFSEPPKCHCGNELDFVSTDKATYKSPFGGWREFCSSKCSRTSSVVVERRKQTTKERFGEDSWAKTDVGKKAMSGKWDQEKKDSYNEKAKKTALEKYGVEHYSKTSEYLERRTKTCLERYGVENCFQDVDKIKQKSIEKNGYYGWFSSEDGKLYNKNNNPAFDPLIKDKRRLTYYTNRTEVNPKFIEAVYTRNKELFAETIEEISIRVGESRKNIAKDIGISYENLNYYMRTYDMEDRFLNIGKGSSYGEIEVYEFVKSLCPDAKRTNTTILKPKHLDIYVESKNLAIEYDGIYHHSVFSGGKDKRYHIEKTNNCERQGIKLLHIFDTEWEDEVKQDIWKSIITNSLGKTPNKIFARKCKFKKINAKVARRFFDENHLSGFCKATYHFGLFFENELVSAISIGKCRTEETDNLEIIRFASLKYHNVIGALSKLIKNSGIENLMSFADRRISSTINSCYEKLFETCSVTEPNWFAYDKKNYILRSRWSFTTEKLSKELSKFDSEKTVEENLFDNNYDKIYDSGNLKFVGLK